MKHYHILLATVIKQRSALDMTQQVLSDVKAVIEVVNHDFRKELLSPLTLTIGSELLGIAKSAAAVFKIAFQLEESLFQKNESISLRYVVKYGLIETPINHEIAYGMYGKGLSEAHETLEAAKSDRERFHIELGNYQLNKHLNHIAFIYQSLKAEWKPAMKEAISVYLKHQDYKILVYYQLYKNSSGAWKIVNSLKLPEYILCKSLIFQSIEVKKWA